MKKTLIILGGIFAVILVVAIVGGIVSFVKLNALENESKAYADTAIPAVVAGWDIKQFDERESQELRSATREEDVKKLFAMFRRLGKLKAYKGARMSAVTLNGQTKSATYIADTDFENGSAKIVINLIKHGEHWEILGFNVRSPVFLN